jgi:hypothetical protein
MGRQESFLTELQNFGVGSGGLALRRWSFSRYGNDLRKQAGSFVLRLLYASLRMTFYYRQFHCRGKAAARWILWMSDIVGSPPLRMTKDRSG